MKSRRTTKILWKTQYNAFCLSKNVFCFIRELNFISINLELGHASNSQDLNLLCMRAKL